MLEKVQETIRRYGMFTTGMRLGVAVSGGADSMCLLHLLHRLAPEWNLHLEVVHIDHGLRGEASREDAEFVRQAAASYGLPYHIHRAEFADAAGNLEQAAREARHSFFGRLIGAGTVERIATGHTRSDQVETVLYRFLRGSGLTGLCGILPVTESGLVRPLLELTRAQVEQWMGTENLPWRIDETNASLSYARNRL
ncbi:MAG: tRNA lysidine(34) synthetase TilS, partial [Acidobacteriaceae bacterium]|nr:tRNA lysidine(34) synthetase TilS [Acidobacteriaceae bacterium]